jgi:SAM-dependent methyltransferase
MLNSVKALIKNTPVIGPSLDHLRGKSFKNSAGYWEQRYQSGVSSGAGSYGRLAAFKAEVLNGFVDQYQISSVIEYGSGDGAQLKLARYPSYTGVDISAKAVEMCRAIFANDPSKRFLQADEVTAGMRAALSLSLDVVYHLVEDSIFDAYMQRLFQSAERFVIVYSSNMESDWPTKHVRHRQFTDWVAQNEPQWWLHSTVRNIYPWDPEDTQQTSFADFYIFTRCSPSPMNS